jgi:uncharacterized membrane protein (UPF0127 family)
MKLRNGLILLIVALLLILSIFLIPEKSDKVCIEDNCFTVEVVDTPESRQQGLMYREQLDENKGMFFIFDGEGNYPFWMKNTLIPLDIIWINSKGEIVDVKEAEPCESEPCPIFYHAGSAKYVLEINKGVSSELGIEIGKIVKSNLIKI